MKYKKSVDRKEKDANMEWLRILAMLLIILSHIAAHGTIEFQKISFNSIVTTFFLWGG